MKAALLLEAGQPLSIEEVEPAPLGARDVRVRIEASGVCHSDLSVAQGGMPFPLPLILGHEACGIVTDAGAQVSRVKPGDRVVAAIISSCGDCWFCVHDRSNLCSHLFDLMPLPKASRADGTPVPGTTALGTFAEEMSVEETMVVPVTTDLPAEQLALLGCGVATGVGAVLNTAQLEPGSTVAVFGCGGVGQSVIQGSVIAGAERVFAVDPVPMKRDTALRLGATDTIDPGAGDPVERLAEATGGLGVDYAFEVTGLPSVILQTYSAVRRGGTAVVIGMPKFDDMVQFSAWSLFADEKRLLSSVYGTTQPRRDFARLVRMVEAGHLDLGAMVSRRFSLDDVNDAFRAMESGEVIRAVLL
jgi:S-(hydroxymethyl)glutathione dehydrogenase / alcohol dehydrogenase